MYYTFFFKATYLLLKCGVCCNTLSQCKAITVRKEVFQMSDPSGYRFTANDDDEGGNHHHHVRGDIDSHTLDNDIPTRSTIGTGTIVTSTATTRTTITPTLSREEHTVSSVSPLAPLTLPNTLQSFDGNNGGGGGGDVEIRKNHMPHVPQAPVCTLPDGRLIDGKKHCNLLMVTA